MTTWLIHHFFVLVDPYPFNAVKKIWIDQNKKGYVSSKTSLTVHTLYMLGLKIKGCFRKNKQIYFSMDKELTVAK